MFVEHPSLLALYSVNFVQCNTATRNLRCNAACLTRSGCVAASRHWGLRPAKRKAETTDSQTLSFQTLGLAASIAARLTIWPISLACSASERICACTYSLCSRMISVRSLACSSDCA
jgi:hypothetical protein